VCAFVRHINHYCHEMTFQWNTHAANDISTKVLASSCTLAVQSVPPFHPTALSLHPQSVPRTAPEDSDALRPYSDGGRACPQTRQRVRRNPDIGKSKALVFLNMEGANRHRQPLIRCWQQVLSQIPQLQHR